jgi:hypothetical protein
VSKWFEEFANSNFQKDVSFICRFLPKFRHYIDLEQIKCRPALLNLTTQSIAQCVM